MEKNFQNNLRDWKKERLTAEEKALMLERVLARPLPSPYARYMRVLVYVRKPAVMVVALLLVFSTTVAYASQKALPGEALYAIKIRVLEPLIGVATIAPLEKLEWEEEKITRRLMEAEELAEKDELDEEKTRELEKKIEKSSTAFAVAAGEVASSTATTTSGRTEKKELLKKELRNKLREKKGEKEVKLKRLKESAVRALDKEEDEDKERD